MVKMVKILLIVFFAHAVVQAGPIADRIRNCESRPKCVNAALIDRIKNLSDVSLEKKMKKFKKNMREECSQSDVSCQGLYVLKAINKSVKGDLEEEERLRLEEEERLRLAEEERQRLAEEKRKRLAEEKRKRLAAEKRNRLRCIGNNFYGAWAQGGGCEFYGCWYAGGGCNFYGCWKAGGGCNFHGCWNEVPKTKRACK